MELILYKVVLVYSLKSIVIPSGILLKMQVNQ